MDFKPFYPLLPKLDLIDQIPIDAEDFSGQNPVAKNSFLTIVKSDNPLEEFLHAKSDNLFTTPDQPTFIVYEQTSSSGIFRGVIGLASVVDYVQRTILPHENILEIRSLQLANYLKKIPIHAEPVCLMTENKALTSFLEKSVEQNAFASYTKKGGVHSIWLVKPSEEIITLFSNIEQCVVADGHHRINATLEHDRTVPHITPYFSAFLTGTDNTKICAYHREVDVSKAEIKRIHNFLKLKNFTEVKKLPKRLKEDQVIFQVGSSFYFKHVALFEGENIYQLLNDNFFDPVLNIHNLKKSNRVRFIPGERSVASLAKIPISNQTIRIYMPALSYQEILSLSSKDIMLPPKSTWILPKLPTGLVIYDQT